MVMSVRAFFHSRDLLGDRGLLGYRTLVITQPSADGLYNLFRYRYEVSQVLRGQELAVYSQGKTLGLPILAKENEQIRYPVSRNVPCLQALCLGSRLRWSGLGTVVKKIIIFKFDG